MEPAPENIKNSSRWRRLLLLWTRQQQNTSGPVQFQCIVCSTTQPEQLFPVLRSCRHSNFCVDCLRQYLRTEICESRPDIRCPQCNVAIHPNDIVAIIDNAELASKYEAFMIRQVLSRDRDARWCPAPDCSFAVLAPGCAACPHLVCQHPQCGASFCYLCKKLWHPNQPCGLAIIAVAPPRTSGGVARKRRSLTRRLLLQLAYMATAPLAIAALAVISLPTLVLSLPVFVGQRMDVRLRSASKTRRFLVVIGAVVVSTLVAPLLAVAVITLSVASLLIYVYGVLPFSLGRYCCSPASATSSSSSSSLQFDAEDGVGSHNAAEAQIENVIRFLGLNINLI